MDGQGGGQTERQVVTVDMMKTGAEEVFQDTATRCDHYTVTRMRIASPKDEDCMFAEGTEMWCKAKRSPNVSRGRVTGNAQRDQRLWFT